ncbi:MAG TPA: ribonuclease Z [Thermoplasmata archaeon]|nr:ribonuclease Z [Thermoplasmata archaeon]HEV2428584.1 ribonuclease Z [Thermoplasmata archaeon]
MRLTFLGTAGSWPTKERSASAIALDTERELVLFDCGEGTQRQFFQSSQSFMRVRRVFLTHFHGDHFLGLPGLIQSMGLNHRTEPLDVYGPPETREMVERILALGHFTLRFPVEVHPLRPGETVPLDGYTVRTAAADHPVPALAYRLDEAPKRGRFDGEKARSLGLHGKDFSRLELGEAVTVGDRTIHPEEVMGPPREGRSVVYSGDSAPSEEIRKLAHRATLLIHEATADQALEAEANRWGHSSARQAAEIASAAGVLGLFLTHFSSRFKATEALEAEARALYVEAKAARDLLDHTIKQP